jgi:hypothetical protein
MKKTLYILVILFFFSSCIIKEKMVLNENGTGTLSYGFDMSALMRLGKSTDSIKEPKVLDSIFNFKQILEPMKDSIAELSEVEQQQFELLEHFKIRMKVNEVEKEFSYAMEFDFPTIDSIQKMVSPTKALGLLAKSNPKLATKGTPKGNDEDKSNTSYYYDGKTFSKVVIADVSDMDVIKKKKKVNKVKKSDDELSEKLEALFKECKYSIEYHFPKQIKSISLKEAVISDDKKSFVMEVPIEDLKEKSENLGFKVQFE